MPGVPYGSAVGDGSTKWKVVRSSPIDGTQSVFFLLRIYLYHSLKNNLFYLRHKAEHLQSRLPRISYDSGSSIRSTSRKVVLGFFFLPIFPCYSLITLSFS